MTYKKETLDGAIQFSIRCDKLCFTVGHQSFMLNYEPEDEAHFGFMADMLTIAISRACERRDESILGMADCMHMVHQELIEAGIIDKNIAPMFVANAVCAFVNKEVAAKQAIIDRLMLEYEPDAMTPEQIENWASHQCKTRDYESDFQNQTTDLVMSHIDRMNDVCPQTDPAERIIESFTTKFAPILETYLAAKFPGREPARKDSDAKPK